VPVACGWCGRGDCRRVAVEVFSDDRSELQTVHLCDVCRHLLEPPPSMAVLTAILDASRERELHDEGGPGWGTTDRVSWPDDRHHTRDRRESDRRESDRRGKDRRSSA
jgi:hypothetical protein